MEASLGGDDSLLLDFEGASHGRKWDLCCFQGSFGGLLIRLLSGSDWFLLRHVEEPPASGE